MSERSTGASAHEPATAPLLRVRGLSKRFGATQALDGVDLDLEPGSIEALLGQNGAGKSTIIKILAGVYTADAGEIEIGGSPLGSAEARRRIAFIHQDLGLAPGLSVTENIALGAGYPMRHGLIRWSAARRRAEQVMGMLGSSIDPDARVADLSRADHAMVAIARALAVDAQILVLDEPTASLPAHESEVLFGVLRRLRDEGLGLLYVSHRLDEVFKIADRVVIMRDGVVVSSGRIAEMTPEQVVTQIVGQKPVPPPPPPPSESERTVIQLTDVVGERVGPVSFAVREQEIVGLVGLNGAGQVEIGRTVIGALHLHGGEIALDGRPYRPRGVAHAVARGIGFVTSNRVSEGVALEMTTAENLFPNMALQRLRATAFRTGRAEDARARDLIERFGIRPTDPTLPIANLSGGNQQKVIVARWLSTDARLMILEEPTAGVDVGAKRDIHVLLDAALTRGVAVMMISTDFDEVAQVCHRALVFRRGMIVRELARDELTVETLVAETSGAAA